MENTNENKQDKSSTPTNPIVVIHQATCPSISKRSQLQYQLGINNQQQFQLRIYSNSGSGKHSKEWFAITPLLELMQQQQESFSWDILGKLVAGKSVNTAGFIMAVLKHEKVIQSNKRKYQLSQPEEFLKKLTQLNSSHGREDDKQPATVKPASKKD